MRLEGKVALVTGSSQGIGQGIVLRLAQAGADVVIITPAMLEIAFVSCFTKYAACQYQQWFKP